MKELIRSAMSGLDSYFQGNPMIVLVFGLLLYCWVIGTDRQPKERRLLRLTAVWLLLVICPVSAACLMLYQTRFYSYAWIWSLVPVTMCIAWGSVTVLWEQTGQKHRDGREGWRLAAGVGVLLVLFLLLGNQGYIRSESTEDKARDVRAAEVVTYLQELPQAKETFVWGPRQILEKVREQDGSIGVLYGRNMWEPEAAAYAYDAYSEEEQRLFDWMEALEEGTTVGQESVDAHILHLAASYGAGIWVFPAEATERIAAACVWMEEEYGVVAEPKGEVSGYVIWGL